MHDGLLCYGKAVRIPMQVFSEPRGVLTTFDFHRHGFVPVRAFIVAAPSGAVRGGHGHVRGRQLLIRASGEIEVEIRHCSSNARLVLDAENPAIMIEAPVWSRQTYWGEQPTMIVLCDTPYSPEDYIWSEEEQG